MAEPSTDLADLIRRMKAGDAAAREDLFAYAQAQLECMAHKRLSQFGRLRARGVETGDVLNDALLQLLRRLKKGDELDRLTGERDFFTMAAQYMRWALLNTAKRLGQAGAELPQEEPDPRGQRVEPLLRPLPQR